MRWGTRQGVVARELTKVHETFVRGTLLSLSEMFRDKPKGEITLLIEGRAADAKEMNRARPFVSPDGGSFIKVCNAYRAERLLEKRVSKVRAPQLVILLDEEPLSVDNSVGTLYRDTCNSVLK